MTEPHRDGDESLERLYAMLARSRANTQAIEEAIAEAEGTPTPEVINRRRRTIRIVPAGLAAAGGLGEALRHTVGKTPHVAALASASGGIAAGVAIAVMLTHLAPDRPQQPHAAPPPRPPAASPTSPRSHQAPASTEPRPTLPLPGDATDSVEAGMMPAPPTTPSPTPPTTVSPPVTPPIVETTQPRADVRCVVILHLNAIQLRVLCGRG